MNLVKILFYHLLFLLHIYISKNSLKQTNNTLVSSSNKSNGNKTGIPRYNSPKYWTWRYFNVPGKCDTVRCSSPNAYCENDNLCRCMKGYVQKPRRVDKYKNKFCQYEQKKQLKAFLLEFFLPSGIGHFYCFRVGMGIIKLLVTISFCVLYGIMKNNYSEIKSKNELLPENERNDLLQHSVVSLFCISTFGFLICHIFDLYMFGTNQYQDGNRVPLDSW